MSSYGSWSVKGIDDRARAMAKDAARQKGVTLGDYINDLLLDGHSEAGPRDTQGDRFRAGPGAGEPTALDGLARRIEAVEARSTLAITGIDQSVLGLLARLDNTENTTASIAADVERVIDELRETHEVLQDKVQRIEEDDTGSQNLQAMKALEQALGKLAAHIHEENGLQQEESLAIKGRVEAGFSELNDRVEDMEVRVESTLSETAQRVEKAVGQAELRAEGASRHLSERFTAIESSVATKLAKVDEIDQRMGAVQEDVSGAIGSMEGTLLRIQERLNRAESTTDAALKGLEQTFGHLDKKIEAVAVYANPERAEALRRQFEERFEGLAANLRATVDQARTQLANEIERAATGANPELVGKLEATVDELKSKLSTLESQSLGDATDSVLDVVGEVTGELETRLSNLETRDEHLVEQFSGQVRDLAERLEERVIATEENSAEAIKQVGEQVAGAVGRLQAKQDSQFQSLEERIAASNSRQDARLSKALSNVSERLTEMQHKTASVVSPVQKAIASLAARLEDVESFNAPPGLAAPVEALPDMPEMVPEPAAPIDLPAEPVMAEPVAAKPMLSEPVSPPKAAAEQDTRELTIKDIEPEEDEDFVAGLSELTDPQAEAPKQVDFESNFESWLDETGAPADSADDDYAASEDDPFEAAAQAGGEIDPVAALGDWDDGRDEARESDIFADASDEEDAPAIDDTFAETVFVKDALDDALTSEFDPSEPAAEAEDQPDILADAETGASDETPAPEADASAEEKTADYLSRARQAAIAAAETEELAKANGRRGRKAAPAKSDKAAALAQPGKRSSSRLPIYAAASVFALTAAGAGAWVSLRGKQPAQDASFALPQETQAAPIAAADTGPSLEGVIYQADADADLFEEEQGSAAPVSDPETLPADTLSLAALPIIPKPVSLQQAALRGDPVAELYFGEERLKANDFIKGAEFIGSSARQEQATAQYRFAKLHEQGLGVPRDLATARQWTERAAKGGNIKAMHDLAVFYADGESGAQSYAAAAQWFRSAADYGLVDSQYNLAVLYENGLGVSPSLTEALYWAEIAARNGDEGAPDKIAELRAKLTLEEAQAVQRRAGTWQAVKAVPAANGGFSNKAWESGSRDQVVAIQTVLNGLGYDTGTPDGIAGTGTQAAIRQFQQDQGIAVTGLIDNSLVDALNALTRTDA